MTARLKNIKSWVRPFLNRAQDVMRKRKSSNWEITTTFLGHNTAHQDLTEVITIEGSLMPRPFLITLIFRSIMLFFMLHF